MFSERENVLLRWLELNYEIAYPGKQIRLKNFDKDLQDGLVFAAAINNYAQSISQKILSQMRNFC